MTTRPVPTPTSRIRSGTKIQPRHHERLAIIYIRQSTVQQIERHQESTRLQYGLVERAIALGWPRQRVLVIDEDLGRSGASAEGRPGFQRLVAEVGLDHVGLVLGIEMSRLARSCRDWHQLLDICAVFGTLIGDADGVYDPNTYNDRLLLGLKGTMSEAELHVIKQRMHQGRLAKAQRGELGMSLPMGYVRRPSGEVTKDPDEQAQSVIALVFETFARIGTLHGTLRYLKTHGIRMPCRVRSGPATGELEWHEPNRPSLQNLFHNPVYAGAYAYGRRAIDPRRQQPGRPGTGRVKTEREEWSVLLRDHFPAYITWEQYERNIQQLAANCASAANVIRPGCSLLAGQIICGRCGLRMVTQYQRNNRHRYSCNRMMSDYAEPLCQSLLGSVVDEVVEDLLLQALAPSALEVSLRAAEDIEAERTRLCEHWHQRIERASYEAERAFRQYNTVDPENRLVARTLETRWEEALAIQQQLQEEHARFLRDHPAALTAAEREAIRQLAENIPALWRAPSTTHEDRQAIARQLIERVIVTVEGESERVAIEIHWAGGHRTSTSCIRPVARLDQLSYYPQLLARAVALQEEGQTWEQIAACLTAEGWKPPKRTDTFTRGMIGSLLQRQRPASDPLSCQRQEPTSSRTEWSILELAHHLEMPTITLYAWLRQGKLQAWQDTSRPRNPWVVRADEAEIERLRAYRTRTRTWSQHTRVGEKF